MSSKYHIPFPTSFLTVNVPLKQSGKELTAPASTVQPQQPDHGFLSNRPAAARHYSVSSVSSDTSSAATLSAPSSPPTKPAGASVFAAKSFTPLALNSKHRIAPASLADMTPIARSAFLSNR
jgi:hypothetical protein